MVRGITFYYEWEVMFTQWLQDILGSTGASMGAVMSYLGEEMILIAIWGFMYWCIDKE